MQITSVKLRAIIREEIERILFEAKKKKSGDDDYDPSVTADDSDVLLDDDDDDSKLVSRDVRNSIRRYFKAMGLSGHLPKHARLK